MSELKTPSLAAQASPSHDAPTSSAAPSVLTERIAHGASRTVDKLAEAAAPRVQEVDEACASARQHTKQQTQPAREAGDGWVDGLRVAVRRHPLAAPTTARAVGAPLARIAR